MEKTCGNCDSWRTVGIERGYCIFDNSLEDGCLKLHLRDDAACDKHTNAPLPLEQRYQQLAEVARELYKAVEPMHESCNEDTCLNLIDEGWPSDACLYDFRKQLEELGVEVSDTPKNI